MAAMRRLALAAALVATPALAEDAPLTVATKHAAACEIALAEPQALEAGVARCREADAALDALSRTLPREEGQGVAVIEKMRADLHLMIANAFYAADERVLTPRVCAEVEANFARLDGITPGLWPRAGLGPLLAMQREAATRTAACREAHGTPEGAPPLDG